MSDYCREKVLRYPVAESAYDIEEQYPELFRSCPNSFQPAPTESSFVDYVLISEYGVDCGEWGKTRALTENEQNKYRPIFQQIFPDIDMNQVRLVEYCWYNGSEAPDYYDEVYDPFYEEV
jgi:hypothetical protein